MSKSIKEVKFGINTSQNDVAHKLKKAQEFIDKGLDVKFVLQVRGRSSKLFTKEEIEQKLDEFVKGFRITQKFNKGDNYYAIAKPPKVQKQKKEQHDGNEKTL